MRDYKLYLDDILEATERIERYIKGLTFKKLKKNTLVLDGIVRNLEIIGEAAKNIPIQIKEKYPDIEWKKISGLRNILAHEYFGIDTDILWNIVNDKLPVLRRQVAGIIKRRK